MILRTKLDDPLLLDRPFTDFAPTLVRRIIGGRTENERRISEETNLKSKNKGEKFG
jgi:hypothetical protein